MSNSHPNSPYIPPHRDSFAHPPTPSAISQPSPLNPHSNSGTSTPMKRPLPEIAIKSERKGSVDSSHGDGNKKKRISLSCAQCAKRKQKCNREFPCQHCIARKVPELCVPYNPQANSSGGTGPDAITASRLDRIESVLSVVLRHHGGIWGYKDVRDWMNQPFFKGIFPGGRDSALEHDDDLAQPWIEGSDKGKAPAGASTMHGEPHDLLDLDRVGTSDGEEGLERFGDLDGGMPENASRAIVPMQPGGKVNMRKHDIHGTPAENLQRLITDCGVSPHKVAELVQELPPKHYADKVIDWFFAKLNYTRYPIDERLFRISYEDLYNKATAVDPSNVRALPLVFIVLALAVRLAPEEWAGDDQTRRLSSLRMYWSSRRSILIATAVQPESIELVVTRLLSSMYLVAVHDRRLTECWSQLGASLRTAQAIGLHRDGSKLGLDPFQTEYRRRIWSYLYHADKLYSLVLGRPPSISDSYTDTLPPSNVELNEFNPSVVETSGYPISRPLSQPTSATFLILRKHLAKIVGKVVHHFQKLDEPAQYSDVEKLQQDLDRFVEELPPHFRMYDPDKSLDSTLFWLPVHRFTLLTEVLVTTIILHRPWLLRKLSSNRYAASRTACFEAAKMDFQIRQDYQREVPDFKLFANTGQFKMFNSAMIAGISAIIDPRGPDGVYMRKILTTFLEQNPWSLVSNMDETTRKEVQIIQTLSRRAAKIYEESFSPGEVAPHDKDSVSLLLALRNSGDATARPNQSTPGGSGNGGSGSRGNTPMQPPHSLPARNAFPNIPSGAGQFVNGLSMHQSPASTGSNSAEEDHSQRLLDHWLNANHSLAVGSINGQAPPLDPAGLGYLPMPGLPGLGAGLPVSTPVFGFGGGGFASVPGITAGGGSGGSGGGGGGWGPDTFVGLPGVPAPTPTGMDYFGQPPGPFGVGTVPTPSHGPTTQTPTGTGHGGPPGPPGAQTLTQAQAQGQFGAQGLEGAFAGTGVVSAGVEGENSDEYWNALIDGILGTTGALSGAGTGGAGNGA